MDLTRRDALAALAASGVAVAGGSVALAVLDDEGADPGGDARDGGGETDAPRIGDHERETLVAVARVVYPSAVSGVEAFVTTYLDGRATLDDGYVAGVTRAVSTLDEAGREWHGGRVVDLDPGTRDRLLREVGADTAEPDPEGSPAERVRYYAVNELLYALYTSPTGGELVGIENPQGHPGGQASYQRGPPS